MRIPQLQLENFRSIATATLVFDTPVTFVIGRNGASKSTIIDALQWAFTGHCRGTDARGVGSHTLLRATDASGQMRVGVQIADADGAPLVVVRAQTPTAQKLSLDGAVGPKETQAGVLFERLGVTPAIVDACLQTDAFLALHHAEAKHLLLDVLDVRVPVGDETLTLGQVDARYKHWFEVRRTRKAALAALTLPPAPAGELPDVPAIEARLATLRAEEKTLLAAASEATGRRGELDKQITHVETAIARTQHTITETATVPALDGAKVDLADAILELQERVAIVTDEDADDAANHARVALVDAAGRLTLLADTHVALAEHSPDRGCVLDGTIPCKTPAKYFSAELATLQAQIDTLTATVDEAQQAVEKARLRAADSQALIDRLDRLQRVQVQRATQTSDLADLERTLARLQADRDACPADTAPSPELQTVQGRIAKGEEVLQAARDIAAQAARHAAVKAQQLAASRELAEAERLTEVFGPNGARVQALTAALGQFEAAINQALERFGYRLQIEAEPWRVVVNGLSAALLSTSERLRVGIALQLAIAEATGFHCVAIDQVDLLDGPNRALLGELLSLRGSVQVVAAATKDDDFEPPAIEGWTWVRVTKVDGVSTLARVEQAVCA